MKAKKITEEILKGLKPENILYAEYAEEGAMGACGTARIYVLEKAKLVFYLVDDIFQNKQNEAIYAATISYLDGLATSGILLRDYGGFGNYGFKAPKVPFSRDDDHFCFIVKLNKKTYKITASCKGVYDHLAAGFAEREMTLEKLSEYFNANWQKMKGGECWFFKNYLEQSKRMDGGESWFDFTVFDYLDAVGCLKHLSGENYLLNNDDLSKGFSALFKYRLRDVTDKIGWNKLNKIFVQMVKAGKVDLFNRIEKAIGEPVEAIFDSLEVIKSNWSSLGAVDAKSLERLFSRPVIVDFTKPTHVKIIKDILGRSAASFNPDAKSIAFYLANYLLNEDKLPFSDILPAVAHIIEVLPTDDFNHTHTDQLFWLCGEIIDRAWRYLAEDEEKQKKYRALVYELYWPRVGSLWPVLHRNEFEFKHEAASKIFSDSLSFVMSLEDIAERNAELGAFLKVNARHIGYDAGPLGRRAFIYTLKGLEPKEEFERILDEVEPKDYYSFLSYPKGIAEARILMDELFRTDKDARITGLARMQVLESLLITPNTMGVGEYILNCIDDWFDEFVMVVSTEALELNSQPALVLEDLFVAMSKGITEENEFSAFLSIEEKLVGLSPRLKCDVKKLDDAAKYARKHRRTILFQRSALQKLF